MAGVLCPHCGAAIYPAADDYGSAVACARCGQTVWIPPYVQIAPVAAPAQQPQVVYVQQGSSGCLGASVAMIWAVVLCAFCCGGCGLWVLSRSLDTSPGPTINPRVMLFADRLTMRNPSAKDWDDVEVIVRGRMSIDATRWTRRVGTIKAGHTLAIPLREFTNDDGQRWNAAAQRVAMVSVHARIDGGLAVESVSFD